MTRTTLAPLALVVVGLVLAGCTTKDDPEPTGAPASTTTAAPTTQAPTDPLQTSPDEARNAYLNYVNVRNQVTQDYFRDWDTKILDLTTGEERMSVVASAEALAEQGYHRVGDTVVKTIPEVLVYEDADSLGNYRAEMKTCVNTSDVEWVAEGRDTLQPEIDGQFYFTIVMQRTVGYDPEGNVTQDPHGQGWWRVSAEQGDAERPC